MPPTVLALHGFTLNGATMKRQMGALGEALEEIVELRFLDAPHSCPPERVRKLHERWGLPVQDPPHLRWWDSSDDGHVYQGWETSRDRLVQQVRETNAVGLIGFSQGAIAAASVAAIAEEERLSSLRFVVLIAGRVPRADVFRDSFAWPIQLPSLHVWGTDDRQTGPFSPELADCFAPELREVHTWSGPHMIPRRGKPARAIVDFVRRQIRISDEER